ncbi:hypothetical protein Hdeb2414_s0002g00060291 [Helianthus debilis subsp. tardiflorus]
MEAAVKIKWKLVVVSCDDGCGIAGRSRGGINRRQAAVVSFSFFWGLFWVRVLGSVHDTVGLSELSFGFDLVRSSLGLVMVLAWFRFRGAARVHSGQIRDRSTGQTESTRSTATSQLSQWISQPKSRMVNSRDPECYRRTLANSRSWNDTTESH